MIINNQKQVAPLIRKFCLLTFFANTGCGVQQDGAAAERPNVRRLQTPIARDGYTGRIPVERKMRRNKKGTRVVNRASPSIIRVDLSGFRR